MATSKLRDDHLAQYNSLVHTACRGDATAVKAVLDADDRVGYFSHEQGQALLKACVTAPNAVALLAIVQKRSDRLIRGITSYVGMAFLYASLHRADVATVEYIVNCLNESSVPTLERDLLWATTTRNVPLVLDAAINTDDQPFVLRFMGLPAVQAFLASLEATFKPWIIRHGGTHHLQHAWLDHAIARNMDAVVAMAAERCLLVTADIAFAYCALNSDGASKYADLCARRDWLSRQIEEFHQAIEAGNVGLVSAMLEEVPVLRRSRLDNRVTALLASALAPNSIALLECLLDEGTSNNAVVQALVHACRHDAAAASIDHLWNWVESFDRDVRRRDRALWEAINSATSNQNVVAVSVLLPYVRDWKISQASDFIISAMITHTEDFAGAVMELPAMEAYFKTLKDKGHGALISMDGNESDRDAWDCVGVAISDWVDRAVHRGLPRVTACFDKWWPALTCRAAFMLCNSRTSKWVKNATFWSDLSQRYVRDETWLHTRDAYLVQRRVLPGLDHLGESIATYLYVFVAVKEFVAHV